jgi:hypothetical protein
MVHVPIRHRIMPFRLGLVGLCNVMMVADLSYKIIESQLSTRETVLNILKKNFVTDKLSNRSSCNYEH